MRHYAANIPVLLCAAALTLAPLTAMANDLHPLGKPLPDGAISFELRDFARNGEALAVEATYQPYRERDMRKESHFHLFDSIWRIGSKDKVSVHREETHSVIQTVHANGSSVNFTMPLHATDEGYEAYQLVRVRVGRLIFEQWFKEPPALTPAFGLQSSATGLQGKVRPSGIHAAPLNGSLPLWPALRTVQLSIDWVACPDLSLWDSHSKHYWDGWRYSTPQAWPGGETIVTRHVDGSAVWLAHSYSAYGSTDNPLPPHPLPPAGVLPGSTLDIFWPDGDKLNFPDVNFERPASIMALRIASLTPRARDILARSVELRPGIEQHSVTADEWTELKDLAEKKTSEPVEFKMPKTEDGKFGLVAHRRKLAEPWLYLFGLRYDEDRRYSVRALVLNPQAWSGPLPE